MASGSSIATAYVQILPTTKGIESGIAGALGGLGGAGLAAAGGMGLAEGAATTLIPKLNAAKISAMGAAAAIASFLKSSVKVGMNFDAAMSQVYALMAGANDGAGLTADEMTTLRDRAREMGSTTQYTATEVADAMSYMALAGWDAEQVYDNIPAVLQLAAASNMDLAQASDIVTDYMAAFSSTAPTATELVDLLAYAQANSNAKTAQFAEAWHYSVGMMDTAGQSAETTTAILARMAGQSHKGSTAGVELTQVMSTLVKEMDGMGNIKLNGMTIPLRDAEGNFRNMIDVFGDMQTAMGGLDNADAQATLAYIQAVNDAFEGVDLDIESNAQAYRSAMEAIADPSEGMSKGSIDYMRELLGLFENVRAFRGISAILNGEVSEMKDFETALYNSEGFAGTQMSTMTDNLAGDVRIFNSAMDDLKITVSDAMTPTLRAGTQAATGFIQAITGGLQGKPTEGFRNLAADLQTLSPEELAEKGARIQELMEALNSGNLGGEERAAATQELMELRTALQYLAFDEMPEDGQNAMEGLASGMTNYDFAGDAFQIRDAITGAIDNALDAHSPAQALVPTGENAAAGVGLGMQQYDYSADALAASAAIQAALAAALAIADWVTTSAPIGSGIARGIQAKSATVSSAAGLLITNAKTRMRSLIGSGGAHFKPLGVDIAKGLAQGIRDGSSYVLEAINNLIDAALKGASVEIERGSPSRLFAREIGKPIAQGVGMGIRDNVADPVSALTDTMDTLTRVTAAEFAGAGSMPARGGFTFNQTVNSPRALTPWEVARQARNAARQMAEAMA